MAEVQKKESGSDSLGQPVRLYVKGAFITYRRGKNVRSPLFLYALYAGVEAHTLSVRCLEKQSNSSLLALHPTSLHTSHCLTSIVPHHCRNCSPPLPLAGPRQLILVVTQVIASPNHAVIQIDGCQDKDSAKFYFGA